MHKFKLLNFEIYGIWINVSSPRVSVVVLSANQLFVGRCVAVAVAAAVTQRMKDAADEDRDTVVVVVFICM